MAPMAFYDQSGFSIRCEWGLRGLEALLPTSDVVIIVDVFTFSTAVDVAVARGAHVYPFRAQDETAAQFAKSVGAHLADPNRTPHNWSLCPGSLAMIPRATRLVLPSPNGSTLSLACDGVPTFAGSIRNSQAIAAAAQNVGARVSVIAAGERWPDGTIRPALEDWIGAGAIIANLDGSRSPEAESAEATFLNAQCDLLKVLQQSSSGRELIERGFGKDVECASALNHSSVAPLLRGQFYAADIQ
jgi:2-phosphosulfolactate phosphatase